MLTRALFLSAGWLVLSFILTMLLGTRLRHASKRHTFMWLVLILLLGDVRAVLTFGIPVEIIILTGVTLVIAMWWLDRLPYWNALGRTTWIFTTITASLYAAYIFALTAFTPLHPLGFVLAFVLFCVEIAALLLTLTYAYETLDVLCRVHWQRKFESFSPQPEYFPKVSLHVPAYNEPAEVVVATLRALTRLDYPDYEVLVIDNNTPEESTWRPVQALCRELGPRFRFMHLDQWPGYKSGALNFALAQTAPDAEIIGVIDADYLVEPSYLRELIPAFADERLAFLQTPQDYRDYQGNPFLRASYNAYKYFFAVSMPSRNERNAIIFGGTMGLIRKSVLQRVGGWDEWCITEDAELSLRILKSGYRSIYINKTYGRGLMPFTFEALKRQRFRWCFGGIQILKKHWFSLIPGAQRLDPDNRLTLGQQYHYLVGGLQWFNDLLNLFFAAILMVGGLLQIAPVNIDFRPLTSAFVVMPLLLLIMGLWRFTWALRYALQLSWPQALAAMGNFFSLGWAVALGSIQGLIQPKGVFMRTAKTKSRSGIVRAFRAAQWETGIGVACLTVGIFLPIHSLRAGTVFLAFLLTWQASLYLSAPMYSLLSTGLADIKPEISRANVAGLEVTEGRAARWAVALLLLLLVSVGVLRYLPAPTRPGDYARFQPVDLAPGEIFGLDRVPIPERGRRSTAPPPNPSPSHTSTSSVFLIPTDMLTPTAPIPAATSTVRSSVSSPVSPGMTSTPTPPPDNPPQPPPTASPSPTIIPTPTLPPPTQPIAPPPVGSSTPQPTEALPTQVPTNPATTQAPIPSEHAPTQSGPPASPTPSPIFTSSPAAPTRPRSP